MKIALCGAMYSGKTTLADCLRDEHGWTKLNYTDFIKELAVVGLNAIERHLDALEVGDGSRHLMEHMTGEYKALYRPYLQALGSFFGFDDGFGVAHQIQQWQALGSPEPVIFDNVRFPAQWEQLQYHGFVLVGLKVSKDIQAERALRLGVSEEEIAKYQQHVAEQWFEPEITLDAINETEWLADILDRLAGPRLPRTGRAATKRRKAAA